MRRQVMCVLLVFLGASMAWGQQGGEIVQRSSSPSGLKIREGLPTGGGVLQSSTSSSVAEEKAANAGASAGGTPQAGSGAVQIQGNTAIKANVRNMNSAAVGVNNAARNEVGAIGK